MQNRGDAAEKAYEGLFDLYVLDINVPEMNGFDLLENLRDAQDEIPAMISAEYQFSPTLYGFGGYTYTWVNDTETVIATYHNSTSWIAGLSYAMKSGQQWNIYYNAKDTIYRDSEVAQTIGIGFFSPLLSHWFLDGNYDYGLSDSASEHSWNLRVGYYF